MNQPKKIGLLLTNLGTPSAPTPRAVRRYLKAFLSDPRVVDLPRWLWWLILNGVILNFRPRRSAALYRQIWQPAGSPLLVYTAALATQLQNYFNQQDPRIVVSYGMCYGEPSLAEACATLLAAQVEQVIVLPLYPQYSATTTGATWDALAKFFKTVRHVPSLYFINGYHDNEYYIAALTQSIQRYWQQHGRGDHLLLSFHGLPVRYSMAGDPYAMQCARTAELIAAQLGLAADQWTLSYQSQFGLEKWLGPATKMELANLAARNIARVDVVCPGFAADCLETLEEIDQGLRHWFIQQGGKEFHYIPALNADTDHIKCLVNLVQQQYHLSGVNHEQ